MRAMYKSFRMFMRQIWNDNMLIAVCIAPVLAAFFFKFGIPTIERIICARLGRTDILADYYLMFDLFLGIITPYMFCFASSMVMLTEYDENMSLYMSVTPVGKKGYLIARVVFPAVISFFASVLLLLFFSLTKWPLVLLLAFCAFSSVLSVAFSMLLFALSHNRVEGMAMAKLAGLFLLGIPVPFFIISGAQYLFSFLPSFWVAKLCIEENFIYVLPAVLTISLWIMAVYSRFEKKLS